MVQPDISSNIEAMSYLKSKSKVLNSLHSYSNVKKCFLNITCHYHHQYHWNVSLVLGNKMSLVEIVCQMSLSKNLFLRNKKFINKSMNIFLYPFYNLQSFFLTVFTYLVLKIILSGSYLDESPYNFIFI